MSSAKSHHRTGAVDQSWWQRRWKSIAAILATAITAAVAAAITGWINLGVSRTAELVTGPKTPPVPFSWSVQINDRTNAICQAYSIDKPPSNVPLPPPGNTETQTWAKAVNGVDARFTNLSLTLQGSSTTAVVLRGLRVKLVQRDPPLKRQIYYTDYGCGAGLEPRFFEIDLDKQIPVAKPKPGLQADDKEDPAVNFPYQVSATDPEVFEVTAATHRCDCTWYLELDWTSEGRTGTLRIDDHGQPFRTSAEECLPAYYHDAEEAHDKWLSGSVVEPEHGSCPVTR